MADVIERTHDLQFGAEVQLQAARVFNARVCHVTPGTHYFFREGVYWVDLCLTPRRPRATARFVDHWSASRHFPLGSILAFPPGERLELRSSQGDHASLICELEAQAVHRWLPSDFTWTERRLETVLDIASEPIRASMLKLNSELRSGAVGSRDMCNAVVTQLSIDLARHMLSASEADEKGGLATWRERLIEQRLGDRDQTFPTVLELAELCKISPRQLSRAFRASRGCSAADYLIQYRIEMAKRLLCTRDKICDIAHQLGFASQSSFTAAFRKSTGVTPKEFRSRLNRG